MPVCEVLWVALMSSKQSTEIYFVLYPERNWCICALCCVLLPVCLYGTLQLVYLRPVLCLTTSMSLRDATTSVSAPCVVSYYQYVSTGRCRITMCDEEEQIYAYNLLHTQNACQLGPYILKTWCVSVVCNKVVLQYVVCCSLLDGVLERRAHGVDYNMFVATLCLLVASDKGLTPHVLLSILSQGDLSPPSPYDEKGEPLRSEVSVRTRHHRSDHSCCLC